MSNTDNAITVTYDEIVITYDENRNVWQFELRGRQRSADSLADAKKAIDKPVPEKVKAQQFQRFDAWTNRLGYSDWQRVTVTSIAESGRYASSREVWTQNAKGDRGKVSASSIFPCTEANNAAVARVLDLQGQVKQLQRQADKTVDEMAAYVIVSEDEVSA